MTSAAVTKLGPVGRLGRWAAGHARVVFALWAVLALGLGMFAPKVEDALSGAGWEASGSESVAARDLVQREFDGLSSAALMVVVHSDRATVADPQFRSVIARSQAVLERSDAVTFVAAPRNGTSISRDGHTAVIQAGAARDTNGMVRAAHELEPELSSIPPGGIDVNLAGASGMWSDFNEANKEAMLKSELISWPVTLAILVLAFGSLVAAGLPLMLTILGLTASAGMLYLGTHLAAISIWAMNFALMFALALGVDYALFVVHRFRGTFFGSGLDVREAVAETMDTAGKAVLFSGLTVLISLSAVMLVPSPAFRSMSFGIMLAVVFVMAATVTLLPAALARLGPKVDALSLKRGGSRERASARFSAWGSRLWRRPLPYGLPAAAVLVALALPVLSLDTGMPSIRVVPEEDASRQGYEQVQAAFGEGAPGALHLVTPAKGAGAVRSVAEADPGVAAVMPPLRSRDGGLVLLHALPKADPSDPAVGATIDRLRDRVPAQVLVAGAAAENHDLEEALDARTPLVIAVVLTLGFVLLLFALRAPLVAALGVVTNLLATGAAFGAAKLIFQDGNLSGVLGFESQGFLDAWGPVFFFAMIFAISMDYTVFLLASAKEHYDASGSPRTAMIGGLADSGRVIFAAAGVMVAVFFTFALSGPLPPKEMGIILGVAVLLDAALIRLLLMPVLLRLAGRWAWWLPRPLERVLPAVRVGHAS